MRVLICFAIAVLYSAPVHAEALDGNAIKATFFNGQPFIASSPTRQRYTMVFTPDGKATREPLGKAGDQGRRDMEGREGRLLHLVEGRPDQLLSPRHQHRCRRQMVGDEGRDHGRELDEAVSDSRTVR